MSRMDELKKTFFEESTEQLEAMETSLADLREGGGSDDTINAVFRAVHSVKGGAGIFGFERLVGFAHVLESVLDQLRHRSLAATSDVIDVLFVASDVLADLVESARSEVELPASYEDDCRISLQQLLGKGTADAGPAKDAETAAPADFEEFNFTPVSVDGSDTPDDNLAERTYTIAFRPKPAMLTGTKDPLALLRELRALGALDLTADAGALPHLSEIAPDQVYVGWHGTLRTSSALQDIEQIFESARNDCELEITELGTPPPVAEIDTASASNAATLDQPATVAAAPVAVSSAPAQDATSDETTETAKEARAGGMSKASTTTIRVDLERIDRVVNMVGELVIAQAMLSQIIQTLPEETNNQLWKTLDEVTHHTRELKNSVMAMRAQPVKSVFQRTTRLVREVSAKTGKKVHLEMIGENTEVDKTIIERLSDPLVHIIRNSIDHGIELPAERLARGKSETGTVRLSADQRGGRIVIEVRDDGAGINSERVLKKAREKGLVDPNATLSEDEINNLIFLPGFSTAETVSDISGRGVGMDVVRRNIQDLGGRITLKSVAGQGMTIQLALPLTLAVMDGMIIRVGNETFVMPISAIVECLRPNRTDVCNLVGTRGTLQLRGDIVPLVYLGDLLQVQASVKVASDGVVIIIEASDGTRLGLVIDELCGHQQVVIKSIEENYHSVPGIAAATILGNGRVAFILDIEKLPELAREEANRLDADRPSGVQSVAA
jgi:two-component system chemotaxis sensor kinase CheA